ncbi:MAG: hypothetical protein JST28_08175 [Acidobacteria bacterium]|nr:hypothetical protein [Acidobacteriota bacterium]
MNRLHQTQTQHPIRVRKQSWCKAFRVAAFFCSVLHDVTARCEPVSGEYHRPIQVQLVTFVDVHHFHVGSTFFVKVEDDWTGLGCFFRKDQILEGRVVASSLRRKKERPSQLALAFDKIPCLYDKVTIDLVLAAAFFDPAVNIPNAPFPVMRATMSTTGGVKNIQRSFVVQGLDLAAMGKGLERPPLEPGEVKGIKGVTLRMDAGPGRSSILESSTHDVWLDKEALLLLVPSSIAFLHPSSPNVEVNLSSETTPATEPGENHTTGIAKSNVPPSAPAIPEPPRDFLPCQPPACNADVLPAVPAHLSKALESIAIRPFGYAPRPQREIGELDNDDALAWLGSHQVIVAFNPHKLISRDPTRSNASALRRIHAIVVDTSARKVISTADWELADRQAYLWQLANDRVLVHVDSELRILGPDMQVEVRIPLDGPLAFVRTSPSSVLMAVGVIHEGHSPELHKKLREALDHDPDEEVRVRILDKNFETIAQATSSRGVMAPVLLDEGQVRLLAAPQARYRLEMIPWQGQPTTIARFSSGCLPSVSSFAPDLLFVATCSPQSRVHEYRVLRPNGAVVLHGRSDPQNLGQGVLGVRQNFAVKVLHAKHAIVDGSTFHGADLDSAEIRIYRSTDGANVNSIHTELPPPSRGAFALSADGSQLAILSDAKVTLFGASQVSTTSTLPESLPSPSAPPSSTRH